jgi:predicted MFS family arabinose efflux permease
MHVLNAWRRAADLPKWLLVLLVGQLVNAAGALAWLYLTLYLVDDRHLSVERAGLAAACFGAGLLMGNLSGGWLADSFGVRPAALISLLSWSVTCLVMPLVATALIAAVAGLAGLCSGASRPIGSALIAMAVPSARRREAIAVSRSATNAGFIIGPPIGGLLAAYDFGLVFVVDAATSIALAAVVWWKVPNVGPVATDAGSSQPRLWPALRRDRPVIVLLFSIVVIDTAFRQVYTSVPLLLRDDGAPAIVYGCLLAFSSVVIVLFEAPIAVWFGRRDALKVIAAGFVLVGLGFGALGLWPVVAGAVVAVAIVTAGEMLYKPTATAYVADAAPDRMMGRCSSLHAAASISGMMLGPALGGVAYQHIPRLLWPLACAVALAAAVVLLWTSGADARSRASYVATTG